MRTLAALLVAIALSSPAQAAQRIMFDPGGFLHLYIERFNEWRRSGELVIIDGMCISACTLSVGLIHPDNICATPFARLGFHSAQYLDRQTKEWHFDRESSRLIWWIYPPHVREILLRRGWQEGMEHAHLIYVEGDELHSIVRPCTAADIVQLEQSKAAQP